MRFPNTLLGALRLTGFLEGTSFILLLGIAMPLKYLADRPEAVSVVGMAHGVLFVAYVGLAVVVARRERWPLRIPAALLIASFLPFGPFYADRRWLKPGSR